LAVASPSDPHVVIRPAKKGGRIHNHQTFAWGTGISFPRRGRDYVFFDAPLLASLFEGMDTIEAVRSRSQRQVDSIPGAR